MSFLKNNRFANLKRSLKVKVGGCFSEFEHDLMY
jgi:hypothetical protein